MKKKIFVIFTYGIHNIGGTQMYTAGKAKYLKENGWGVQVFFNEADQGISKIPSLTEYIESGGGCYFMIKPPYQFSRQVQEQCLKYLLNKFLKRFNLTDFKDCEIIVESHYDVAAYWAELFSSIVGARHIFVTCNEVFRDEIPGRYYEDNLDYFYFKWKRNELWAPTDKLDKLFNGYKNVTKLLYDMPYVLREQDPVQDVDFPIDKIQKLDWNICHIGRIVKDFVPYAIEGVAQLARKHPDKSINFIFVGNIAPRKDFIIKTFKDIDNVQITALGDLVPIPRILFSKIDVICAIAGSASHTSNEGVYVLLGNAYNPEKTPGVLGFDTYDATYGEAKYTWVESLENILVNQLYDSKKLPFHKPVTPPEHYYNNFWTVVKNAAPKKEYYIERLSQERIRDWTAIFPFGSIARGARIILFGATEIAKDYRRQIDSQANSKIEFGEEYIKQLKPKPYCQIVAIIDEHSEEFDNAVVDIERLKQKDYDVIVISMFPQQAQAAYNKIVQTVPDMTNKVIYEFKTLQI